MWHKFVGEALTISQYKDAIRAEAAPGSYGVFLSIFNPAMEKMPFKPHYIVHVAEDFDGEEFCNQYCKYKWAPYGKTYYVFEALGDAIALADHFQEWFTPTADDIELLSAGAYFNWGWNGIGSGQLSFSLDRNTGKLTCMNECMSRERVRKLLHAFADHVADNVELMD